MTPKERKAYDEHLNAVMIQNDVLDTAKLEGIIEGRAEGIAEGRAEGRAEEIGRFYSSPTSEQPTIGGVKWR